MDADCIAGWVCSPRNATCVREGTQAALPISDEIPCNAIDEDNDGVDAVESGTVLNCAGCNDSCLQANVAGAACIGQRCVITSCMPQYSNADNDPANGCELNCNDSDNDGICDSADNCLDGDRDGFGVPASNNCPHPLLDPQDDDDHVCGDADGDTCDDCTLGSYSLANDGPDTDADGACDAGDNDSDNDGVPDTIDVAPGDPNACGDFDGDGCDDCGPNELPEDSAGFCEVGDADGDGRPNVSDNNDLNGNACSDDDGDGCDDCALGTYNPNNDGTDSDHDGVCVASDCHDGIFTCTGDCTTNSDDAGESPNVADCVEDFCGSDKTNKDSVCHLVPDDLAFSAISGTSADPDGYVHVLIGITGNVIGLPITTAPISLSGKLTVRQTANTLLRAAVSGSIAPTDVFSISGTEAVELSYLRVAGTGSGADLAAVVAVAGSGHVVAHNHFDNYGKCGITLTGNGVWIAGNTLLSGFGGSGAGGICVNGATRPHLISNAIANDSGIGIRLEDATSPSLDYNTLFHNNGAAVSFAGTVTGLCMRNNIIDQNTPTFATGAGVTVALGCSTDNVAVQGAVTCSTVMSCIGTGAPASSFSTRNPGFMTTNPAAYGFLCPTAILNDSNYAELPTGDRFDRNGSASGTYNGSAPEPGARERGTTICP